MKSKLLIVVNNQRGSVINVALLILILIFLIGIGLSKISLTDIKISTNMKTETATFYEAEAGLDAAGEMIEQNMLCSSGFTEAIINDYFYANNREFGYNPRNEAFLPNESTDADFFYPHDYTADEPHTNVKVGGVSRFAKGSAIQMAAGYEGLGKGSASGGGSIVFDVYVRC